MFCKSDLSSQVLTTLVMYHDYSETLTEVDDVLQECGELPGINDTCHVFRGILTEVDDVQQKCA